jgi:coenzyme F420-0:L-glutamate ligase/coenzyme F420-1:gamma-L-glutamate ligase
MRTKRWATKFLLGARVAHLATLSKSMEPYVVPVCYAFDGKAIYSSVDEKPKRVQPRRLRRMLNITENPKVSLVVDFYTDDDWRKLKYVIVQGTAKILETGREHGRAVLLLKKKYHQYRSMRIERRPVIRIEPVKVTAWRYTDD